MTEQERKKFIDELAHKITAAKPEKDLREIYFAATVRELNQFSNEGLFEIENRLIS